MGKKLLELVIKKNCKIQIIAKRLKIQKSFERKGDKLYVKWKGYDNLFNPSIDKKDMVET